MNQAYIKPDFGSMPVSDYLPTLLKEPIAKLQKLASVAGITAGGQQADSSTILTIAFSSGEQMNYRNALDCFKVEGLRFKAMYVNIQDRLIHIKLAMATLIINEPQYREQVFA